MNLKNVLLNHDIKQLATIATRSKYVYSLLIKNIRI